MAALDFRTTSPNQLPAGPRRRRPLLVLFLIGLALILTERLQDSNLRRSLRRLVEESSGVPHHSSQASHEGSASVREELRPLEKAARGSNGFQSLKDDTPSLAAERDLMLQWFDLLHREPEGQIRRQSTGTVLYEDLLARPELYRGRLVSLRGVVRRVGSEQFDQNDHDLRDYYQIWLYPGAPSASPLVICCLTLPEAFPVGANITEQVEVTGLFAKRWAYQAQDGVRIAPLLLARSLQWQRPISSPSARSEEMNFWLLVKILTPAVLLTVFGTWYAYRRTEARGRITRPDPSFEALQPADDRAPAKSTRKNDESS